MSEPIHEDLKQIVNIFLREYNKKHGTSFRWDDGKSYLAKQTDKPWVDAVVFDDNGEKLEIQHKEVVWDKTYDKIRNKLSTKIVEKLKQTLIQRGLSEYSIHLNFDQKYIINNDKEVDEFCYWVTEFINLKSRNGYPKSYHLFLIPNTLRGLWIKIKKSFLVFLRGVYESFYIAIDKSSKIRQHIYSYDRSDKYYLDKIMNITSYIDISRDPKRLEPVIGWGYSEPKPRPLPHYSDVIINEIKNKIVNKYNDLIVILDCNKPVDEYDRKEILRQISEVNFMGQIWLVENFANKKSATCIYET